MRVWLTIYHHPEHMETSSVCVYAKRQDALTEVACFLKDKVSSQTDNGFLEPEFLGKDQVDHDKVWCEKVTQLLAQEKIEEALEIWTERYANAPYYPNEFLEIVESEVQS